MRIDSPLLVKSAGSVCAFGLWSLFRSLRKDVRTRPSFGTFTERRPSQVLFSVWHDSAVIAAFGVHHDRTMALTSRHRDGEFVANVVRFVGVGSIRGSSGKSGGRAARKLLETAKTHDIVMTPDGPRGPRRIMSRGIVYLASRTGNAIVPTAFVCANAWEIPGSWTTQVIPKPFSRVVLMAGEPLAIPADLDSDGIEHHRQVVQQAMDELHEEATDLAGGHAAQTRHPSQLRAA